MSRRAPKTPPKPSAALAAAKPTIPAQIAEGREPKAMELASAVATEHALLQANAPVPSSIQAVLDADPEATDAARAELAERIEKAEAEAAAAAAASATANPETPPADPASTPPADPAGQA